MRKTIDGLDYEDVFYAKTKDEAVTRLNEYLENGAINAGVVDDDGFGHNFKWVLWAR